MKLLPSPSMPKMMIVLADLMDSVHSKPYQEIRILELAALTCNVKIDCKKSSTLLVFSIVFFPYT